MATTARKEIGCYRGEQLERLVEQVDRLVSLPDVYYRLESLIEQPGSSLDDFARLLSSDPDLCARLLRVANSAFYSFPVRIESIRQAVQLIGMRQIRELVLATSIANVFRQAPLGMIDMQGFWRHSVAAGVMAKCLGEQAGRRQLERYYVAGLLHDIGRLAFFIRMPELMSDLLLRRERDEVPLHRLEQTVLGYDHAAAGSALLQRWRVPGSIHLPVGHHHDPGRAMEYGEVAAAIHVADVWVNREWHGSGGERFQLEIDDLALVCVGLEFGQLAAIWQQAQDEIKVVMRHFLQQ